MTMVLACDGDMGLPVSGRTAKGTPVTHMWECQCPDPGKPGAGFPKLDRAVHTKICHASKEPGAYSHHAQLAVHGGVMYAMWSNHPNGEDSPGQFVRWCRSTDGIEWSSPEVLFPSSDTIGPFHGLGVHGAAMGWVVHDGRLHGLMTVTRCAGYANADGSSVQKQEDAQHIYMVREAVGRVAREMNRDGSQRR